MEYGNDIEQLVKSTFDNYEADVNPDAWLNIQSSLNIQPASDGGSVGNTASSAKKFAGISSKFSVGSIIGTTAAIIGITASVIYFESEKKEMALNNTVTETKTMQTVSLPASDKAATNVFVETEKKSDQPVAVLNENSDNNKQATEANKSAYYSSTNEDVTFSSMNKKDAEVIAEEKNSIQEIRQAENKIPAVAETAEKSTPENLSGTDASDDAEAETKSNVSPAVEEKTNEYYLGNIPNVITPNGDGNNDAFVINGKDILNLKVTITDPKTGKTVHHWNNLHGFWDGRLENGQAAKEGFYFYNIFAQPIQGKPFTEKGTIQLILK